MADICEKQGSGGPMAFIVIAAAGRDDLGALTAGTWWPRAASM